MEPRHRLTAHTHVQLAPILKTFVKLQQTYGNIALVSAMAWKMYKPLTGYVLSEKVEFVWRGVIAAETRGWIVSICSEVTLKSVSVLGAGTVDRLRLEEPTLCGVMACVICGTAKYRI